MELSDYPLRMKHNVWGYHIYVADTAATRADCVAGTIVASFVKRDDAEEFMQRCKNRTCEWRQIYAPMHDTPYYATECGEPLAEKHRLHGPRCDFCGGKIKGVQFNGYDSD